MNLNFNMSIDINFKFFNYSYIGEFKKNGKLFIYKYYLVLSFFSIVAHMPVHCNGEKRLSNIYDRNLSIFVLSFL
jgi:hypothetical protein